ncbi:hypothetical protein TEA_007510 [Camellia sinensis var. sinensis]|uniref:RRM domain-containing protein n=1 Tax=Camellia sinensis var. sinensis TaxID=542762 RepID=A0A4S4EVU5_CAMSN|nr:hypothetical protein TEA_007510 [Camellia sinensis var. sinensis]
MHQIITLPRLVNWCGQRRGVAQRRSLTAQLDSLVNGLVNGSAYGSAQWYGLTARLRRGLSYSYFFMDSEEAEYAAFKKKVRRNVYIDNLSPQVTEAVLRTTLNQFGNVEKVQFIPNYTESRSIPRCAFVEMENSKQAKQIVSEMGNFPFMMSGMPRPIWARAVEMEMFDDHPRKPGRKIKFCWLDPQDPDFKVAKELKLLTRKHAAESSFVLKLKGWYSKDDVVAEWKEVKGDTYLDVHCYVSGPNLLLDPAAEFRYHIFSKELPLVLKAVMHGDSLLFTEHQELLDAFVRVYFHSSLKKYNRVECWGPLKDAAQSVGFASFLPSVIKRQCGDSGGCNVLEWVFDFVFDWNRFRAWESSGVVWDMLAFAYSRSKMVYDALFVLAKMKDLKIQASILAYNSLLYNLRHTGIM